MKSQPLVPELQRRQKDTEQVIALCRAHDGQVLHWRRFFAIAPLAWRSRIANARKVFCREQGLPYPIRKGGVDPLQWNGRTTRSGYRYRSRALGRDAADLVAYRPQPLFQEPGAFQR